MDTKPTHSTAILAAALLMLPFAYVGAYFALLTDYQFVTVALTGETGEWYVPHYRVEGEITQQALFPAHCLDRWIRSSHWRYDRLGQLQHMEGDGACEIEDPDLTPVAANPTCAETSSDES